MFKTKKQIKEVSNRTGIPCKYIRELGVMMSKVKIAQEDLQSIDKTNKFFTDAHLNNSCKNLREALCYFENIFLKCKLW